MMQARPIEGDLAIDIVAPVDLVRVNILLFDPQIYLKLCTGYTLHRRIELKLRDEQRSSGVVAK